MCSPNVVARQAGVPTNVTVILVDLLNTSLVDQHYARRGLVKFLGQIQTPGPGRAVRPSATEPDAAPRLHH
jgi:hypothetical protein